MNVLAKLISIVCILAVTLGVINLGYLDQPQPPTGTVLVPEGVSPDYLMSKDGKSVLMFQCVGEPAVLKGTNPMTDGVNTLFIYQMPCWEI